MDDDMPGGRHLPSLYEVLQVSPRADPEVVHAAYRVLARIHHPDLNPAPDAARFMRRLNAAYEVLRDPERRARYDASRARSARVSRGLGTAERDCPAGAVRAGQPATWNAALPLDRRALSPLGQATFAMMLVGLIFIVVILLWIVFPLEDRRTVHPTSPPIGVPELIIIRP
jgi:hypothetical protein